MGAAASEGILPYHAGIEVLVGERNEPIYLKSERKSEGRKGSRK